MYKIYIDTTERYNKSVKIVETGEMDTNVPNFEKTVDSEKGDIDIISTLAKLLNKNKIHVSEVLEVIPNQGPGSFTGIKMGITDANIINWALNYDKEQDLQNIYTPNYGAEPNITPPKKK